MSVTPSPNGSNSRDASRRLANAKSGRPSKRTKKPCLTAEPTDCAKHADDVLTAFQADTDEGRRLRKVLHDMLGGDVYFQLIYAMTKDDTGIGAMSQATASKYALELVERMKPRDPLEEMLVMQCLWAHSRVAHLSILANQQTIVETIGQVNDSVDKASNTFRRLMLALVEYRRPPKMGDNFTAIKQANIANQQVVQNTEADKSKTKNMTNEQGIANDDERESEAPKTLPADTGGIDIVTPSRPSNQTVASEHRPDDARRQSPLEDERLEAR